MDEPTFRQQLVAHDLLEEMFDHRLQVVLIPAPDPQHCTHCIRVAVTRNPKWYRALFETYGYLDCRLLRRAFYRIMSGLPIKHRYDYIAMLAIDERMEQQSDE